MVDKLTWDIPKDIRIYTLRDAIQLISHEGDKQEDIPFIIKLFENPKSILALPGSCSLKTHDYIHIILKKGFKDEDEAYVLGYTMGNDPKCKCYHIKLFRYLQLKVYPDKYKFDDKTFDRYFSRGFRAGRANEKKNIHQFDFDKYLDYKVKEIQEILL